MLVFRPDHEEVLVGKIKSCSKDGVTVSLEFFDDFENVIVAFDNDKAGKEASVKVARLFKPGKARILTLPNG